MKTLLAGALLAALPALAQTGFTGMSPAINPAMMLTPGMGHLLGMRVSTPFNPFGLTAPLGMGNPMLGGLMYPGMQLAPNLLSHQYLQYMTNPYLGGPAAGNPYLKTTLPNPFTPPSFAPSLPLGGYGQSAMPMPSSFPIPLSSGPRANPYLSPGPGQFQALSYAATQTQRMPLPFVPGSWFGQSARPPMK